MAKKTQGLKNSDEGKGGGCPLSRGRSWLLSGWEGPSHIPKNRKNKESLFAYSWKIRRKSLKGLKKLKYDKEHEHELAMYENTRTDLDILLAEGKR